MFLGILEILEKQTYRKKRLNMETLKPRTCSECPALHEPCLASGGGENPAHLIVVGQAPSGFSIGKRTPFFGHNGRLFKQLLDMIRRFYNGRYGKVRAYYTYATLVGAYVPNAQHLRACQPNLLRDINNVRGVTNEREPVIVTLGPIAAKAVGIKFKRISDIVGRELTVQFPHPNGVRTFSVIPLLSMPHLNEKIGTARIVIEGLVRAVQLACDPLPTHRSYDVLTAGYAFPQTIEELRTLVDYIINYYNPNRGKNSAAWVIALDTETNTLKPYAHPDPRTLMLSVAWDEGKAATILLDHPLAPYPPAEAWVEVRRLLTCPKPKVFHNWKFDLKFLELTAGVSVHHVSGDTMLWEHYLDEDKKGHYGLKRLTPLYTPEYEGYDEVLSTFLRGKEEEEERASKRGADEFDLDGGAADVDGEESIVRCMTDDALLEADHVTGCPDDLDDIQWGTLIAALRQVQDLSATPARKRSAENKAALVTLKAQVKELRRNLDIQVPKRTRKKEEADPSPTVTADSGFEQIPLPQLVRYAATDADVTRQILRGQMARLQSHDQYRDGESVMTRLYLPGSRTLGAMEYRGVTVDTAHLRAIYDDVTQRIKNAENVLHSTFDSRLNLRSPKQILALMCRLNFETLSAEDTGGTGKDQLDKYAAHYPPDDPRHIFASKLREYRETHKVLSTYVLPIRRYSRDDGKVHCQFHLNGTATGRLSSSRLNMQNIIHIAARRVTQVNGQEVVVHPGYNIKKCFIPSRPGNIIVNMDIKGAELRVYTVYSQDPMMIDALKNGKDVHSYVTSQVYKIPYDEVQAKKETDPTIHALRTNCKRTVFGTFYGAGPYKIAQQIGSTTEEAKKLQEDIFNTFTGLRSYVETVSRAVHDRQIVETVFGRFRRFRLAHINKKLMAEACREAINFLIQSTSSDLVLSQLCEIDDHIAELEGQLLLTVHDSITFEMPEKNVDKLFGFLDYWIVERVREKYPWLPVDFLYDIEVGPSYGELTPLRRPKKEVEPAATTQAEEQSA